MEIAPSLGAVRFYDAALCMPRESNGYFKEETSGPDSETTKE